MSVCDDSGVEAAHPYRDGVARNPPFSRDSRTIRVLRSTLAGNREQQGVAGKKCLICVARVS